MKVSFARVGTEFGDGAEIRDRFEDFVQLRGKRERETVNDVIEREFTSV